jgi:hypothetical protein
MSTVISIYLLPPLSVLMFCSTVSSHRSHCMLQIHYQLYDRQWNIYMYILYGQAWMWNEKNHRHSHTFDEFWDHMSIYWFDGNYTILVRWRYRYGINTLHGYWRDYKHQDCDGTSTKNRYDSNQISPQISLSKTYIFGWDFMISMFQNRGIIVRSFFVL